MFPPIYLLAAIPGLLAGRRRRRRAHLALLALFAAPVLLVMLAFVKASYLASVVVALLPATALGSLRLDRWISRHWPRAPRRPGTAALVVVSLALCWVQPIRIGMSGALPVEYYRAAKWVERHLGPADLCLCDAANFAAAGHVRFLTGNSWEAVAATSEDHAGPVYLVTGDAGGRKLPAVVSGAKERLERGEIELVTSFRHSERTVWVFRIR